MQGADAPLQQAASELELWCTLQSGDLDAALRGWNQLPQSGLDEARRGALLLRGEGDLVSVAHALHRITLGSDARFIVCDHRRQNTPASVRGPENLNDGMSAFAAAIGGSLCVRISRLPQRFDEVLQLLQEPESEVQLFVCMGSRHHSARVSGPMVIHVPRLEMRELELPRIVDEYGQDAIAALRAFSDCFTTDDRSWVIRNASRSISEIEKATLRVVALQTASNIYQAAARLGMAAVSLTRWLTRRTPLVLRRRSKQRLAAASRSPSSAEAS